VLRLAGVSRIAAVSPEYPGSLLDVRHAVAEDCHEVERALSLATAAGFPPAPDDDLRLRVRRADGPESVEPYVVVHPGASVTARAWAPSRFRALVERLRGLGSDVRVTGSADERVLTEYVAGGNAVDLGGRTTVGQLAGIIGRASAVVCGNTGPAHLAAAVGTPVVSLFAPTVPAARWRPWGVPHVLLGDQEIACAGCRARTCPVPGHPCLSSVSVDDVLHALAELGAGAREDVSRWRKAGVTERVQMTEPS
jgi:ADP-heptose:LPS heptosyltransferase